MTKKLWAFTCSGLFLAAALMSAHIIPGNPLTFVAGGLAVYALITLHPQGHDTRR